MQYYSQKVYFFLQEWCWQRKICQANKTALRGSGYEVLIKCVTTLSANALISYAKSCENEYVTVELEHTSMSEVIAREYQYHRSCYKKITRKPKEKSEEEIREMAGYEKCFDTLKEFVKEHIICNGVVMKVSQLSSVYADLQEDSFGDSVSFFINNTETSCELIYSNNPAAEHKKVHTTLSTERENVENVAKLLRNEINSYEGAFNSWPPTSEDLVKDDLMMPHLLEKLYFQRIKLYQLVLIDL